MTTNVSDLQARLVATLALSTDKTLVEMAADMREMSARLVRDMNQKPPCQYCDAGVFCWWHATHEEHMAHKRKRK
jgi:hydroxylamine reductase (hybrid-cluster protein)